jgi:hypothetical protein
MSTFNRDIVNAVLDALRDDPALADYVKSFTAGDQDAVKKLFPFITVANMRYSLEAQDTANDVYVYTVEIMAGTRSLAKGTAYEGDDSGRKGILQLCEDIVGVVRTNTFNRMFSRPVSRIRYKINNKPDSGGAVWVGIINFACERIVLR